MLVHILMWFRGYLLVSIRGYSTERFINLCSNRSILIWNLKKTDEGYQCNITVKGYRQLKPVIRKTKTLPYIKKKIGFPFLVHRYRNRKVFFFGILMFFCIVYVMSLYIWDIGISGQYSHTSEAIIEYLDSIDVKTGVMKKNIDCQNIEKLIRKEYNDIGWVSAEIKGTRLLIKITETNMPAPYEEKTEPCHIIAGKDGIITSIITRKGIPKVKAGDIVKKGDILVSGVVEIVGDNDILLKKEPVIADADITMKSYYEYNNRFELNYIDKEYTSKESKYYGVSLFGKTFYVLNPLKSYNKFKKSDSIVIESKLKLGNYFYLPIKWKKTERLEYVETEKIYTSTEANEKAKEELERYIQKLIEKGVLITENNVKILIADNYCISSGKLIVEETIMDYRLVEDDEWRIADTDELSGDNN